MAYTEFSWLNEISLRIAYGDYPNEAPEVVFLLNIADPDLDGDAWNDAEFLEVLEPLTWKTEKSLRHQVPYDLSVKKAHFSWGADGAGAEVLLYIASHALDGGVGALGGIAAMTAMEKLRARLGRQTTGGFTSSPDELREYGEWSVRAAFREWIGDSEDVVLVEESRTADEWTGTFRSGDGRLFDVTLRPEEGRPYRTRVARRAPL